MPGVTVTRTFLDSLFSVGWRPLRVTPVHGGKSRAVGMDQLGWSYPISGVPALRAAPGTQSRTSPRLEQAQRRSFRRGCLQTNIVLGQTEIVQLPPHRSHPSRLPQPYAPVAADVWHDAGLGTRRGRQCAAGVECHRGTHRSVARAEPLSNVDVLGLGLPWRCQRGRRVCSGGRHPHCAHFPDWEALFGWREELSSVLCHVKT